MVHTLHNMCQDKERYSMTRIRYTSINMYNLGYTAVNCMFYTISKGIFDYNPLQFPSSNG